MLTSGTGWARAAFAAQVVFVLSWLVAMFWQGPRYDPLSQSISDMYAVTAPAALFLVVVLTLCGLATVGFAAFAVPAALPGRAGGIGALLLGLSIFGLGDVLSPFEQEACRIADPGCGPTDQTANLGGLLDAILSTIGVFAFAAAAFVLAAAMRRTPGWARWATPARWVGVGTGVLVVVLALSTPLGLNGLAERLVAAGGAAAIAAFAVGVRRRPRPDGASPAAGERART